MKIEFEVSEALVITGRGPDKVFLKTNYKEACYPYRNELILEFTAAQGSGAVFIQNQFGIDDSNIRKVINVND